MLFRTLPVISGFIFFSLSLAQTPSEDPTPIDIPITIYNCEYIQYESNADSKNIIVLQVKEENKISKSGRAEIVKALQGKNPDANIVLYFIKSADPDCQQVYVHDWDIRKSSVQNITFI